MKDKCPTCGCDVKVSGEGSTHFFVPLQKDKKRLTEIVQSAFTIADYQDEQWSDTDTVNLIVKKIMDNNEG